MIATYHTATLKLNPTTVSIVIDMLGLRIDLSSGFYGYYCAATPHPSAYDMIILHAAGGDAGGFSICIKLRDWRKICPAGHNTLSDWIFDLMESDPMLEYSDAREIAHSILSDGSYSSARASIAELAAYALAWDTAQIKPA